jgi:hypothetical protein
LVVETGIGPHIARHFPPPWSTEVQPNRYVVRDANKQQLAYVYYENELGRLQHVGDEPKTICNDCDGVEPAVEGVGRITTLPAEQGSPVIAFLPIAGLGIVEGSAGETAAWGGWVTVFPPNIGLVVFVLGICASAIVRFAIRPMTLRPISAMRFSAMVDLPFGCPKSVNAEPLSGLQTTPA